MCSSPQYDADGRLFINPKNDRDVWNMLMQMLEIRMKNGEFTVIDATNSKTSEMNKYKHLCDQYRYRMYCVDFTKSRLKRRSIGTLDAQSLNKFQRRLLIICMRDLQHRKFPQVSQ